jgi:5-methylthioribose kinase
MILLDEHQLPAYLRERGLLAADELCRIEVLSGGVSNLVLRVGPARTAAFVVKQSRERLQTQVPWFSRLDRIFRETAMMETLRPLLPDGAIPRILDEDRENYAYAMQAVDLRHTVWKRELLAGRVREEIAVRLADYLSAIHGRTVHSRSVHGDTVGDPRLAAEFGDQEIFEQLRVDPFYRHIARVHPELRPHVERLIAEMAENRVCLVHADFSPKNVLVVDRAPLGESSTAPAPGADFVVTLIDFETGHFGDPAFDLGFFLSHLLLKGVRSATDLGPFRRLIEVFWDRYRAGIAPLAGISGLEPRDLERRSVAHLAACSLARVDGTSPVDYLTEPAAREAVRDFSGRVMRDGTPRISEALDLLTLRLRPAEPAASITPQVKST